MTDLKTRSDEETSSDPDAVDKTLDQRYNRSQYDIAIRALESLAETEARLLDPLSCPLTLPRLESSVWHS